MQRIGTKTTITLSEEDHAKIREIAEYHGIAQAEAHRRMLHIGMELWSEHKALGILRFSDFTDKIKKAVKEWRQPKLL